MTTLTIKIPPALKAQVQANAQRSGKSVSAIVRASLLKDMRSNGKKKISLLERAGDLCGCFDSGVTDLATHPKHLKNFGKWRR